VFPHRYPHRAAGQVAAPIFAVAGLIAGYLTALWIPSAPVPFLNAVVWAAIEALAAFLAFSSESRAQRPASVAQAAAADGVVAGITGSIVASSFDLFVAVSHAFKTGGNLTGAQTVTELALAFVLGGAVGSVLGLIALRVGKERLVRVPVRERSKKKRSRGRR
jgi:hypothetical protein